MNEVKDKKGCVMIPEELKSYDYRNNLICDADNPILIHKAIRDRYSIKSHQRDDEVKDYHGKAFLGTAHGEDALTWNVLRSLQLEDKKTVLNTAEKRKCLYKG